MKRLFVLGLIAASWALVIAIAMCAQRALAQNPIPDSVTNKILDGLGDGGFKGMFWLAATMAAVLGICLAWVVKKMIDNLTATAAVALEQAKADQKTGDRLTSMENGLRAKGIIT